MSAMLARARALIGTPFKLQGRDPAIGIDCVGLVILAGDIIAAPRPDYRRRGDHLVPFLSRSARWFRRVAPRQSRAGDVVIIECGQRSWHVGILDGEALIHADPNVGRVVRRPGELPGIKRAVLRRRRHQKKRD